MFTVGKSKDTDLTPDISTPCLDGMLSRYNHTDEPAIEMHGGLSILVTSIESCSYSLSQ